jgi:hypothetical protein
MPGSMRPAYRYSLLVAVLLVLVGLAAWSMRPAPSEPPAARPTPSSRTRPGPAPAARPPADRAEVPRALERLERDEAEQLGPEQAAARRRQRERMILERGGELPAAVEPAAPPP